MSEDSPGSARPGAVLSAFALVIGLLSGVAQIVLVFITRDFTTAGFTVAIVALLLVSAGLFWLWRREREGLEVVLYRLLVVALVSLLALPTGIFGYALGRNEALAEGRDRGLRAGYDQGYVDGRQETAVESLFVSYKSTNDDDARLGASTVLGVTEETPKNEYAPRGPLGFAYAPDKGQIPGTHLVYDFFCTGSGDTEPCAGALRAHLYSKDLQFPTPWRKAADQVKAVARLFSVQTDGSCPGGGRLLYRHEGRSPAGAMVFDIAFDDYGGQLSRTEPLGCLLPP